MTGVGGRPELVLEGAKQLNGPWTEIPFKYKPGALDRPCPFIGLKHYVIKFKQEVISSPMQCLISHVWIGKCKFINFPKSIHNV